MDLGISGKRALVCASSKGLGRGCAMALAEAGVNLILNARGADALEKTAQEIRDAYGVEVTTAAADIVSEEGRAKVLDKAGQVDILVTNAGGPPPGYWTDWEKDDFLKALESNMLTPIALMKSQLPGMIDQGWGRVVNITSASVKSPIGQLGLSNSARAGLTGYVAGTARQVCKHGVIINNLLPGSHDTDRIRSLTQTTADREGISFEEAAKNRDAANPTGRIGQAEDFGATCAFMCSAHVGFIVGQNILLDGGSFNSTL